MVVTLEENYRSTQPILAASKYFFVIKKGARPLSFFGVIFLCRSHK
jgi:hypothetical protein